MNMLPLIMGMQNKNGANNNFDISSLMQFASEQQRYGNERRGSHGNNFSQVFDMFNMLNSVNIGRQGNNNNNNHSNGSPHNNYKIPRPDFTAVKNFMPAEMVNYFNGFGLQ